MRILKFTVSLFITLALVYFLDNRWIIQKTPIPPLGKFLDPFHGFWQNAEPAGYKVPENLTIPGLKAPVKVVFDSLMIAHIFAENDADLYLAQGYVTAMHRLWQMEIQTHAAAGRVSEIVGAVALDNDRYMRRLGMAYGAQHSLEAMMSNPDTKTAIEKYSEGVNAYIQSLGYNDLPFEYKLLNYLPEPWTPLKSALFLKNMENKLCMRDKDMEMTNALKLYGLEVVDLLYPDRELATDAIVDNPKGWKFKSALPDTVPMALPEELIQIKKKPGANPHNGSNNWAVSGSKTATGSPILCNDPHLELSLPSIWYVIQLHAPGTNSMGASLPGSPAIISGHSDSIAWGITNGQRDLVDWFRITFQNAKKEKYLRDGKWVDTKKVVEAIKVRGQDIFYDTVTYTDWGPVTYDETFHGENNLKHYAFRWIAHDGSNQLLTFYKLNRAKNHADYMEALNHFASPGQNFVFASVGGDVAMRIQGKFPVRRKNEGRFVLDGDKSSNGWQAFIPNEQNIQYKNPARGFVSSANQYPVDETYPYYITAESYETYRNRRINQVLGASDSITVTDMMNLQNDYYNLKAAESLPTFLAYLDSAKLTAEERKAYGILKSWDYFNTKDSEGASHYEVWWDYLVPLVWDEMQRKDVALSKPTAYTTIRLIKENPDLTVFDLQSTPEKESARDIVRKAFTLSVDEIQQWKAGSKTPDKAAWADFKDSRINHLLRLDPLSFHVRAGGSYDVVNAYAKSHGPSWRMVVSLERSGVNTWAVLPGGQSGNPGSRYYANMIDPWVNGQYMHLLYLRDPGQASDQILSVTQLTSQEK